jgi:hypothetical protein
LVIGYLFLASILVFGVSPGEVAMPLTVPESRVLEIWQSPVWQRADLKTVKNEPVRIIYPGRPNDGRGADLKDAVIATAQGLVKGDIEFHVRSSGWWQHGHHEDPAYNSVILHIVRQDDAGRETVLQNGMEIPTIALEPYTEEQAGRRLSSAFSPVTPAACKARPEIMPGLLDEAGEARFSTRIRDFQEDILDEGAGQALYQGIMTALGYTKNKQAMAKLARSATLRELEDTLSGPSPDNICPVQVQTYLLGAAGLLPSQRFGGCHQGQSTGEFETELEQRWEKSGKIAQMSVSDWQFFKVRPGNLPVRRIAAVSALLVRYRKQGILPGLRAELKAGNNTPGKNLEESLMVKAEGYWEKYMDFSIPVKGLAPALIGKERAGEIIINVLLPFYSAYAREIKAPELEEKSFDVFRRYPAAAENSLEKHMRKQLGLTPGMVNTAQKRQGLLHIYKTLCTQGKCGVCPLNGAAG